MQLIKINKSEINGAQVETTSARELHAFLGVGKLFGAWINDRINQYGFVENQDFIVFSDSGNNPNGGRPLKEYAITIDMAKELSMVERNDKGREARQYFIQCEQKLKQATPQLPDFTNPAIAARAWADEVEAKQKAIATIEEKDKLIVAVADLNIRAGDVSIKDFSNNLAIKGLGQNNLFAWLKARGYLMDSTEPYRPYVERGYFVRKPYEEKINGKVRYKTMLTPRGCAWLSKILHAEFELDNAEVA